MRDGVQYSIITYKLSDRASETIAMDLATYTDESARLSVSIGSGRTMFGGVGIGVRCGDSGQECGTRFSR
jgi:hypothetical protein